MSQQRVLISPPRYLESEASEQARPIARPEESRLAAETPDASPLPIENAIRIILHTLMLLAVVAFLLFYCVVPALRDVFF